MSTPSKADPNSNGTESMATKNTKTTKIELPGLVAPVPFLWPIPPVN